MSKILSFGDFNNLNEAIDPKADFTPTTIKVLGFDFKVSEVYKHYQTGLPKYRLTNKQGGQILSEDGEAYEKFIKRVTAILKEMYKHGEPKFHPRSGDKFIVKRPLGFTTGAHSRNPGGTGSVKANIGDVIVYDRDNDYDQSFWKINDIEGKIQSLPVSMIFGGTLELKR
jgi:hypothetical protein